MEFTSIGDIVNVAADIEAWDAWAAKTIKPPLIVGHEFVGEIVEVGSNVNDFRPGDLVSGEGHVVCGRCRHCLAGRRHLCAHAIGLGVGRDGAFAEYVAIPMTNVWHHWPGIDEEVAAIFDPFGNAMYTTLEQPVSGRQVLVLGCGTIGLMAIGMLTTLVIREPQHRPDRRASEIEARLEQTVGVQGRSSPLARLVAWLSDAVVSPFVEFFQRSGSMAVLILLLVGCYKLSDITMGVMANPFYIDLGFGLDEIANVTKVFGFFMTIAGAALGGLLVARYGILPPLLAGAILVASTNLLFVWLAVSEPRLATLAVVVSADNLSGGFATSAFIAWLSSLTSSSYTATQYALFSSLMTLPAKFIGGFAGMVVDSAGYASFFLYAGLLGVPAILLVAYLLRHPVATQAETG